MLTISRTRNVLRSYLISAVAESDRMDHKIGGRGASHNLGIDPCVVLTIGH